VFDGFTGTIMELRLVEATYVIGICEEAIDVATELRLFEVIYGFWKFVDATEIIELRLADIIYGFWKFADTTEEEIELRLVGVP